MKNKFNRIVENIFIPADDTEVELRKHELFKIFLNNVKAAKDLSKLKYGDGDVFLVVNGDDGDAPFDVADLRNLDSINDLKFKIKFLEEWVVYKLLEIGPDYITIKPNFSIFKDRHFGGKLGITELSYGISHKPITFTKYAKFDNWPMEGETLVLNEPNLDIYPGINKLLEDYPESDGTLDND